jgi:mono/diheme cytochrome c family protein
MTHPLLAAEAAGGGNVPVIILIVALLGFGIAYFVVGPGRRRGPRRNADIPLAMRPYHSDEELESRGMERAMAWGVALAVFASLFIPLYWLIEPDRINRAVDDFYRADVDSGRVEYQNACASCHGENLGGGSAPHPDPDVDTAWPAPALDNAVARYQDSEVVEDVREFLYNTIDHGRPGTPMQAFGVGYGGSLSDNQISQIVAYILSVQTGEIPDPQGVDDVDADDGQAASAILFDNNCAATGSSSTAAWARSCSTSTSVTAGAVRTTTRSSRRGRRSSRRYVTAGCWPATPRCRRSRRS